AARRPGLAAPVNRSGTASEAPPASNSVPAARDPHRPAVDGAGLAGDSVGDLEDPGAVDHVVALDARGHLEEGGRVRLVVPERAARAAGLMEEDDEVLLARVVDVERDHDVHGDARETGDV